MYVYMYAQVSARPAFILIFGLQTGQETMLSRRDALNDFFPILPPSLRNLPAGVMLLLETIITLMICLREPDFSFCSHVSFDVHLGAIVAP